MAHLCVDGEQAVFACRVEGGREVSLCRQDDALRYRFGRPDRVELTFPSPPTRHAREVFTRRSTFGGPRVSTCTISFDNAGHTYALEVERFHDERRDRLAVARPDGRRRVFSCVGAVVGDPCDVDGLLEDSLLVELRARVQTLEQALAAATCLGPAERAARRGELDALKGIVSPHAAWRALEDDPMDADDDQVQRLADTLVCPPSPSPPPSP
jgi:hypothetical protein